MIQFISLVQRSFKIFWIILAPIGLGLSNFLCDCLVVGSVVHDVKMIVIASFFVVSITYIANTDLGLMITTLLS